MLILNIADIHFQHPKCSGLDPDKPYRTRLIQDARANVALLGGTVNVILVCGDIAYAGLEEEYEAAYVWLKELATETGCPLEQVFVVPGNHDVDRSIIQKSPSTRNVHTAIRNSQNKEQELFQQFHDPKTAQDLFAPINAYNAFAARFNCELYSPKRLFWLQELSLEFGVKLRLYGLNSTILSGQQGNDKRQSLYLSPLQTILDPEDNVVNAVVCHHPPDWCEDIDEIEDALHGRASLQFFGHKHRQRVHRDYNFIRFSAGAVNPDRREGAWEPGYNLIKVTVVEEDQKRFLKVEGHLRTWITPNGFQTRQAAYGEDVHRHKLVIDHYPANYSKQDAGPHSNVNPANTEIDVEVESIMSAKNSRNLVLRFWELSSHDRLDLALHLNLVTQEELALPEGERYGKALKRAGQQGLLKELEEEINKREAH